MSNTARKPVVTFYSRDEETIDVQVNGESVGELTYDQLGWSGLDAAKSVMESLAEALGATIETEE